MKMDFIEGILIGMLIGIFMAVLLENILLKEHLEISKQTANDICIQLTNNTEAIARAESKKLICEIPSFDETQNIIIRKNSDRK